MTAKAKKPEPPFNVGDPGILRTLFTPANLLRTVNRMRAWQESENEVANPLRRAILLEYGEAIARGLAAAVANESWSPSPGYLVLVAKRSGTYRELVFPSLLDTIVSRRIIDALEPHITKDDNNKVFFGRSHANADRERGDYENWFKVWLDFSSEIGSALASDGFTYVFDTDITQFFPSVDRERAKSALAHRTRAHQTLVELLFYCIETWGPRVRYCPVPGLPIEPNDVSRLIAHNFIKGVDEHFVDDPSIRYLRWVDDTVMFVPDEKAAHRVKLRHHLALREMGLSPNASKTAIMHATEYQASRHPEFNRRINEAQEGKDLGLARVLIDEWFGKGDPTREHWDKVATRLYSLGRQLKLDSLRTRAVQDIEAHHVLIKPALKYLLGYDLQAEQLGRLLSFYGSPTTSIEARIEIARFLGDVRVEGSPKRLVGSAVGQIMDPDERLGSGYARALFLLVVNKHGGKEDRAKAREFLTLERLQDDQLRLHYLYVFHCRGELDRSVARALRHLDTPDIALLMRLCEDACEGQLTKHRKALDGCLSGPKDQRTVAARHLPFLQALLRAKKKTSINREWLKQFGTDAGLDRVGDSAVRRFLRDEWTLATR